MLDFTESKFQKWQKQFFSQPHQPFFVLGFLQAFYTIFIIALALSGVVNVDLKTFHVLNIAFYMPLSFFLGFLTTVLCKFLNRPNFVKKDYTYIFWSILASFIIANIGFFTSQYVSAIGVFISLFGLNKAIVTFYKTYKNSTVKDKIDELWILILFSTSSISAIFFAIALIKPVFFQNATNFSFYVFTLGTVFIVAQKMIPKFNGVYFNFELPTRQDFYIGAVLVSLIGIFTAKALDSNVLLFLFNAVGFLASFILFYKNKVLFRQSQAILFILQIGVLWFIVGFISGIFEAYFNVSSLIQTHIFGVGFLGTLIIGFGSRVTLGHSGQKINADRITIIIFALFQIVIITRLIAIYYPDLLFYSALLWCAVFLLWMWRYLPNLLKSR